MLVHCLVCAGKNISNVCIDILVKISDTNCSRNLFPYLKFFIFSKFIQDSVELINKITTVLIIIIFKDCNKFITTNSENRRMGKSMTDDIAEFFDCNISLLVTEGIITI